MRRHLPTGLSGEADDVNMLLPCRIDRPQDVRRTPRCRNRDEDISRMAEAEDLPLEQPLVSVVVADCSEDRTIGGQGDRCRGSPIVVEPLQHLAGNMLGVGGTSTITGEKQLAPAAQRFRG